MTPKPPKPGKAKPGKDLALTHGAHSPAKIAERAKAVHADLLEFAPYLDEARFLPAVQRYLDAAAVESLLTKHIHTNNGNVAMRVYEQRTAAARLAAKLGSDLGLDPIGHARIRSLSAGAAESESLADLAAKGKAIGAARAAREADTITPEEDS